MRNRKYFPVYAGDFGGFGPIPKNKLANFKGHRLWDWGAYPLQNEQTPDYKIAAWGVDKLQQKQEKPFLLATGFHRPHVPQYAPQKWFDLYPLESLQLPKVLNDDFKGYPTLWN